ncbi:MULTISPECIES: WXG100 family type VII secretion target [unclassified Streptomyces]|uniref:WXG100 family type VII secretion target n=1 Tax=Streptomyces evansiae TaxID=3075535 RepID=A0ABD5E960_9ACTN|nr:MULTISPECIES: WXG100 family type VII secretion target [unclassified Streptomyces]MYR27641.1 WXG100 family type VII secretion target [Streptomyces sp. SID4945]SCF26767.1 WXG100 family type VII secretion target [Streptomyces sp. LcepLS]ASY33049.1 WXG100 family type VII secretion target [Streptomyces sp. CLI2509]EFL02311.1 conserved hypothetical protein [Streptomyces sp. SPB78]MDT0417608.1 WXG100 family type VII secretion target [Streptomyces sp. DSM 41982]
MAGDGMKGADTGQLRTLSKTFGHQHTNLHELITALNNATKTSPDYWKGPRADRFRDDWEQLRPTLSKFVDSLERARKETNSAAEANDQING